MEQSFHSAANANGRGERGQLMLGAAVVIAVAVIALSIMASTAPVATVTSISDDQDLQHVDDVNHHIQNSTHGLLVRENSVEYTTRSDAVEATRNGIQTIEEHTEAREFERSGVLVNIETIDITPGFVIAQTETRAFTSGGSASDETTWTLGSTDGVRAFNQSFDPTSLEDISSGDAFTVTVTGRNDNTWTGFIGSGVVDDVVIVEELDDGTQTTACSIEDGDTTETVTWTNDSLSDKSCSMTFTEGVEPPYTLSYGDANNISGTYELAVSDTANTTLNTEYLEESGSTESPRYYHAAFSVNLTVTYRSERLTADRDVPVIAPGVRQVAGWIE